LAEKINKTLFENGFLQRIMLLHHTANNFRKSDQPFKNDLEDPKSIYSIAKVINNIIKGTKLNSSNSECRIVIDSLRNSLEINYFKERFSGFYLIAVKCDQRKTRLKREYPSKTNEDIENILEFDEVEYKCSDFQKGIFYAPDVQNCIQKADYHINNIQYSPPKDRGQLEGNDENIDSNSFYFTQEQLIKLEALIQQPGIITPTAIERIMQIAYTAKHNSGCISRQVGAVVTDNEFSCKGIGWNDVPKESIPCALRNVKELTGSDEKFGFTDFELGKGLKETEKSTGFNTLEEIDKESTDFNEFVRKNYSEEKLPKEKLGGLNCPYCFKTAYNSFSGEKNQVHTRSLHAEENAMLQIAKYGGQGLNRGYLFTTASPCELCAKKAYQLGIRTIYYIDPYPGISRSHILKSNKRHDPKMVVFSGAVGRAYFKLYEPFMPQKDEIAILTDFKLETPQKINDRLINNLLKDKLEEKPDLKLRLKSQLKDKPDIIEEILRLVEKGLSNE
jgi:dCMP deaminase